MTRKVRLIPLWCRCLEWIERYDWLHFVFYHTQPMHLLIRLCCMPYRWALHCVDCGLCSLNTYMYFLVVIPLDFTICKRRPQCTQLNKIHKVSTWNTTRFVFSYMLNPVALNETVESNNELRWNNSSQWSWELLGPLLLTWFNFYPSMDK